ncbi:hypothetical protein SAMN02745223_01607 [Devosia limi DSM 17137]|uniref:Uncharacterized protein n=1 Tax=Devosia limi DSM 17137 TaxID=1121477 RepID=A0A1M4YA87_9HYPH|nr:hypothetical protein SAMN02745223_01607 [Devosia limi DSM 17137]
MGYRQHMDCRQRKDLPTQLQPEPARVRGWSSSHDRQRRRRLREARQRRTEQYYERSFGLEPIHAENGAQGDTAQAADES